MEARRDRRISGAVAAAVVASLVAAGVWLPGALGGPDVPPRPAPTADPPRASPTQTPRPVFRLTLEIGRVAGRGPNGAIGSGRLAKPAQRVAGTMTTLYSVGFVDADSWDGGRFPSLFGLFERGSRTSARRDLNELTLGPTAGRLVAVRPRKAELDVRFVTDAKRRPITAIADVGFAGLGIAEDARIPIRHDGRYLLRRANGGWQVAAYEVRSRVPRPSEIRAEAREASIWPGLPSREPFFILVIGSDARPGQSVAGSRADSLHVVGVNPKKQLASIVGIPRDSYVAIPGGGMDKINAALVRGGPELVVETVERLAGIRIDAYLLTGFAGFERMVAGVGGIVVRIPYAMSDRFSHAQFEEGRTKLSGRKALAFARNRHDAPGGDFGRSLNQGRLLIAALAELRSDLRRSRLALFPWLLAGVRHLQTDLTIAQMVDLLLWVPTMDPDRVRNRVVSGRSGNVGGKSVVFLGGEAADTFRDLARDAVVGG